ncbi:MAG TPA: hypothetical protein DEF43_19635 [Chloroflexus aurantiacus]|nr:MAG: hypothetical protein D6716_05340 [Chloroflexota bacterium]HBW69315.1 hypothetical protein [Chloroflexus aurantiacus]
MEARRADDHRQCHLVGLGALPVCHARGAACGVRQPRCRASRAHDPAPGPPLTRLVTRMRGVFVTIITIMKSVVNE